MKKPQLLRKPEAIKLLGVSKRTLEKLVKENRVAVQYQRGKTRPVAVFERGELEALKAALNSPTHRPTVEPQPGASQALARRDSQALAGIAQKGAGGDLAQFQGAMVAAVREGLAELLGGPGKRPVVFAADKLTLNLSEAAAVSGLSKHYLLTAIHAGRLRAEKRGRGWNVKRADLDSYIGRL